ncbi:hypothetical protein ACMD2_22023 [Ananas comosus]|uniref:Uncharacterized protein n=1 Tax=Ananas comosus TaxID=4615 RepID=A0A199W849_ANACO|nr:hypothetical protein ACMD2_22023 [Ananas comosus]
MAKDNIKTNNPLRCQSYLKIIDKCWDVQMSRDLHLAGYCLNPSYHHHYNHRFDDELLKALRNVINRLERNPTHAAIAISELSNGYNMKLVYVHYNMRLHLRCMQEEYNKEKELKTNDPLDASFSNDESDPILDLL